MIAVDKEIVKNRFQKNLSSYNSTAVVQKRVAERLSYITDQLNLRSFNKILEVGCGTGFLTKEILRIKNPNQYFLNDLTSELYYEIDNYFKSESFLNYKYIPGNAESIEFPGKSDAIVSASTVQWFSNLERFIAKVNYHLKENGLFAFSTFGKENFKEIKEILNIGLEYHSKSTLEKMLSDDFEILYTQEWIEKLKFNNPGEVLRHIKTTGVNGILKFRWNKEKLLKFDSTYKILFSENNRVNLTYHPIIIVAKKK